MEKFSLQTFIKICIQDTGTRISELQRKVENIGNGYDFYNSFYRAVSLYIEDGNIDRANVVISDPANSHERKYNSLAFNAFLKKFGSVKTLCSVEQKAAFTPSNSNFQININPLFALEKAGKRHVYCTWQVQTPSLSQKYGAVACHIMRQAFKSTSLANAEFYFYDLTLGRSYSEKQITNTTSKILQADSRMISQELTDL